MKRYFLYLLVVHWILTGYGFTVDSTAVPQGTASALLKPSPLDIWWLPKGTISMPYSADTTIVKVVVTPQPITVDVNNDDVNTFVWYLNRRDSVLAAVINQWVKINEAKTNESDQTYMGYLSHASEYSIGQINKFITQYHRSVISTRLFTDLGILFGVAMAFILLVQNTSNEVNPTPLFVLLERLSTVLLSIPYIQWLRSK